MRGFNEGPTEAELKARKEAKAAKSARGRKRWESMYNSLQPRTRDRRTRPWDYAVKKIAQSKV